MNDHSTLVDYFVTAIATFGLVILATLLLIVCVVAVIDWIVGPPEK